ncbi:MAG: RNA polymerase sigma-70 factor [Bacteroidales bacterium]|nr:RNA polymerase sigma-70 factor [Bacteroidales bacterium]
MTSVEDRYLLQKLKEGDIQALEVLFDKYYGNLCRYLMVLFKNQLLVEHISQDIFIYLWENRKNLEINSSLESYLYTAGKYKALNQLRNLKRQEKIKERLGHLQQKEEKSIESKIEVTELEQIINDAIDSLPGRCKEIFRLSREEDKSYKEIAKLLNISINTVEGQMSIALKKLRTLLRPFYLKILMSL